MFKHIYNNIRAIIHKLRFLWQSQVYILVHANFYEFLKYQNKEANFKFHIYFLHKRK